jgi:thioredoxin-related protein
MRFPTRLLIAAVFIAAAVLPAHAVTTWKTWGPGLQTARASGRPVLVDVYTDWCGWCKRMDRDVYARADVADYLAAHFVTVKLNAEGGELASWQGKNYSARTLAAEFGIDSYPTTVFLSATGERLVNVPGYVEPARFLLLLRYIGDGHMARNEKWDDYVKAAEGGH